MWFSSYKSKSVLVLLIVFLISVIYISLNWIGIIDDAYIFFRYAYNISQGHGYVFNVGNPVEGTTSVTWTVLLAFLNIFHIPAELSVKILGFMCVMAVFILLWNEWYRAGTPHVVMLLVSALLLFDKNFIPSVMMGLETGLYALCLLAMFIAAKWYSRGEGYVPSIIMGGIGLLLFLTRPESIAFLLIIGCGIVLYRHTENARYSILPIFIWTLGILVVTAWRWLTFGDFIPNSARVKSVLEFSMLHWSIIYPRLVAGSIYVKNLFEASWLLMALGIVGLVSMRKFFGGFVVFFALFTGIGVVLINSGDWMPYSRLLTPYLPIVALLALEGISRLRQLIRTRWVFLSDLAMICVAGLVALNSFWLLRDHKIFTAAHWASGECYKKIGLALQPYLPPQALVAPEAIGELGYTLIDHPILDFFGLTDPYIARNGVIPTETYTMGKHHFQYVMQKNPTLFFFHSDIVNHIPWLNQWGYSQAYETYQVRDAQANCALFVGVKNSSVTGLLPVLNQNFIVNRVDTSMLQKSSAPTWPEGVR